MITKTNKRLCSGTLTNTNATLYTAPAATGAIVIVRSIALYNNSDSAVTVTLKLDGIELLGVFSLAARTEKIITGLDQIIEASELIEGLAGTTSVVKYMISGTEITV